MGQLTDRLVTEAFRDELWNLVGQDSELRALSLILPEAKIYEWAHAIGVLKHEQLARHVPPFPPQLLRERVSESELELFLWTGLADSFMILSSYERHAVGDRDEPPVMLDFGCGCGRQTRFLTNHADLLRVHGIDINPDLVGWCADNLEGIETSQGTELPPLPYADDSFDFIYSLSVFTHLNGKGVEVWLDELIRVVKPGGMLLLTIHGSLALERIQASEELQEIVGVEMAQAAAIARDLPRTGFCFVGYDEVRLEEAKAGIAYGVTFIHEEHVQEHWSERLEIVEFRRGGMRGWQDTVLLRKR